MTKVDALLDALIDEVNNRVDSSEMIKTYLESLSQEDREALEKRLKKKGITTARQLLRDPRLEESREILEEARQRAAALRTAR